ncbi:hypothetical protein [Paractinoplanes lichenicola]|uniref:Uncharacterized protein n=1 Tax=Paractinoplanes lichenicola TaxID=2802976 RepID=A0ABS1VDZ5_9ACTN|nr:hypothetical protein [Actinoplanes lichenicola]MBL7252853.1 hypothetical protein [Actinoplanes lichenicola]
MKAYDIVVGDGPATAVAPAEGEDDPDGKPLSPATVGPIRLRERDDPNAGLAPIDERTDVRDRYDRYGMEHLGGTGMNPDGTRTDLSPWYVEVNRLGGLNHGGDQDIAFDLDAVEFLGEMSSHLR